MVYMRVCVSASDSEFLPRNDAEDADVHQQIERGDDRDRAQDSAGNGAVGVADLAADEADVVVAPVVVGRDQHPGTQAEEEAVVEMEGPGREVEGQVGVEVHQSGNDDEDQRGDDDEREPADDLIDLHNAAVEHREREHTGSHRHQRLAAEHDRHGEEVGRSDGDARMGKEVGEVQRKSDAA